MAEYEDREHYIPLRKGDLIQMVCNDPRIGGDKEPMQAFCTLIGSIYHFEYYHLMEELKNNYAPFDPDSQTVPLNQIDDVERSLVMDRFFEGFVGLMEKANYTRLSQEDIHAAIEGGASDWGLNMDVDFDIFEKIEVFIRGDTVGLRTRRHWLKFWKKIEKEVDMYQRTVLVLRLREHKAVPKVVDTTGIYLKLLKDIPKLDLEMVLPGAKIQMPKFTARKLWASLVGTMGYFFYSFWKVIAIGLGNPAVLIAPTTTLGGYAYKQWYGYNVTKQTYAKQLTESLYYQTLDNNNGVLTHIVDEAEEQECREAILAYWALRYHAPPEGWNQEQLDDYIELYLENNLNMKVDFEVDDALDKVLELKIVEKHGDILKAIPLPDALERLDYKWDNYFQYNV